MLNNIAIIIPSYNTVRSIVPTIEGIFAYQPQVKIIVVDDNSPDGTSELIKKHFSDDNRVKLITRKEKGGRGSAVIRGFREGLTDKEIEFFVEMDADLCHDPKYIPLMIDKCRKHDVVIASKYLKQSKIRGLSLKRIIFSRIVNSYIKLMLQIPITDYTNGFRCYRRRALEIINLDSFHSKGFIVLSEIIFKMYKQGCTFTEIPFHFDFHKINKSNFNLTEVKEAFFTILKLKFEFK